MFRRVRALLPMLLIVACSAGEAGPPKVHTIDAPRREVFDAVAKWNNFGSFERMGNNVMKQQYRLPIDDELYLSFDDRDETAPVLEHFRDGEIRMIAERPDRVTVELRPAGDGRVLRYFVNFADGETTEQTVVSQVVDESEGPLTAHEKARMAEFETLMSGRMGPRLVRRYEEAIENPQTLTNMDEVEQAGRRQVVRETVEGYR